MASAFGGNYANFTPITGAYTALTSDDAVIATLATAATVTLYSPAGALLRNSTPGGRIMIANLATSAAPLTLATAAGTIVGPTILSPGQVGTYFSDGIGTWYAESGSSGGAGAGALITAQVALTSANILAMYATPVQIVAAPGAGKILVADTIVTEWVPTATQYAAGGAVIFQYDSTINGAGVNTCNTTIAAAIVNAATEDTTILRGSGTVAAAASGFLNKGLFISNASGAFTTGTGVARITISYRVYTP